MNPIAPGYFLTWHTYGTWLHGDDAGSVDRLHNTYGTPRVGPNVVRFESERAEMRHEPLVLTEIARVLVDKVMRDHCRIRLWDLRALAVRSNHVHVVIAQPLVKPELIVKQLKEWGTRMLRGQRIIGPAQRAWAEHASTVYLYEAGSLGKAVGYVKEGQDGNVGREDWDVKLGLRDGRSASFGQA